MEAPTRRPRRILAVIIVSQFAGTALWFAGNAVLPDLQRLWQLGPSALGDVTAAVQLGFIVGTLCFALLAIADRFEPRRVFFGCSLAGAAANVGILGWSDYSGLLVLRFATGFCLAGIYPVGMRIAALWYQRDLGRAIGLLVAALVLGTAFPHLLRALGGGLPWRQVSLAVSLTALAGGVAMLTLVPHAPASLGGQRFQPAAVMTAFASPAFRASAFGYFGHMWELYTFWAFVPLLLAAQQARHGGLAIDVSLWSFLVIAAGALGCAGGGLVSLRAGSAPVAFAQLSASGACCLLSPLLFLAPTPAYLAFLMFWGVVVVGDSPQLSALNAQNAPPGLVGSALTIANCIGFSITILSLQLTKQLQALVAPEWLLLPLAIGPALGLLALHPLLRPGSHAANTPGSRAGSRAQP